MVERRFSPPVKKGIRSILKGVVVALASPLVLVYNLGQTVYQAYKNNFKKSFSYFLGSLGTFLPWLYFLFLEATGFYRIAANKKLLYDNPRRSGDYVTALGYNSKLGNGNYRLPRGFYS